MQALFDFYFHAEAVSLSFDLLSQRFEAERSGPQQDIYLFIHLRLDFLLRTHAHEVMWEHSEMNAPRILGLSVVGGRGASWYATIRSRFLGLGILEIMA